jgi:hypothetical protein
MKCPSSIYRGIQWATPKFTTVVRYQLTVSIANIGYSSLILSTVTSSLFLGTSAVTNMFPSSATVLCSTILLPSDKRLKKFTNHVASSMFNAAAPNAAPVAINTPPVRRVSTALFRNFNRWQGYDYFCIKPAPI